MKVLFHLRDAQVAGGQIVAEQVAKKAEGRGHDIGLVVPSPGPMVERFSALGAKVEVIQLSTLRQPWSVPSLVRLLRSYDVLYSHTSIPGQILGDVACRSARAPHVIHEHSTPYFSREWPQGMIQARLFRGLRAIRWIAVAEHVREALVKTGISPDRIVVVPNGAPEPASLQPSPGAHSGVKAGMIGRFDPGKGIDQFVAAVSSLADDGVTAEIAARSGPFVEYERDVRARLGSGSIRLTELREDSESFLRGLDVVAIPSHYEGSPLVLFEAMALGRAIVASDIPGIREVIEDGWNGLLVPPRNVEALRGALRRLIEDPVLRKRLGNQARFDAERRFPMRHTVERCLAILEEVVQE